MNDDQLLRYSRQIMLPEIEIRGQQALLDARVLIIGMGGLGCPVAMYLAAAGCGDLTLVDDDVVELSNLQRQIAHTTVDIGNTKVASVATTIRALNPDVIVSEIGSRLSGDGLTTAISRATIVVDCTDNFDIRFAINDACVATATPLVSGAAIRLEGQVMVYDPEVESCPCYRCLYQSAAGLPLNCAENGVAAPVVGMIGSIQANEALKVIANVGETLAGYLLVVDAKHMDVRKLKLPRNPTCSTCGAG